MQLLFIHIFFLYILSLFPCLNTIKLLTNPLPLCKHPLRHASALRQTTSRKPLFHCTFGVIQSTFHVNSSTQQLLLAPKKYLEWCRASAQNCRKEGVFARCPRTSVSEWPAPFLWVPKVLSGRPKVSYISAAFHGYVGAKGARISCSLCCEEKSSSSASNYLQFCWEF